MTFALVLLMDEGLPVIDLGRDVAMTLERPFADVRRAMVWPRVFGHE